MPRDNPRRITARKLLRLTGRQPDCRAMMDKLWRHEVALAKLNRKTVVSCAKAAK